MGHRNTLKKKQKAFKTRHSTKGSIKAANKGRIDSEVAGTAKKHVMSKLERQNQKQQLKSSKMTQLAEKTRIFDGRHGVPRNVAVIPLTPDIDSVAVAQILSQSLDAGEEGAGVLHIGKFRQRLRLFVPQFSQFFELLDAARSADFVMFVLSANQEITDYGEQIMRCITLQGVSTCLGLIWGLDKSTNKEADVKNSLTSWFNHFFPEERLYSLSTNNETQIAGRLLCQKSPKGVHWRDDRSYMVLDKAEVQGPNMVVEGAVRGKELSADEFMHIQSYGDFSIAKIELVQADVESEAISFEPSQPNKQIQSLVNDDEAIELDSDDEDERLEGRGVRIDGQDDVNGLIDAQVEDDRVKQAKQVPEGTSKYQAAWFVEGEDYRSDSDDEEGVLTDEEGDLVPQNEDDDEEEMDEEVDAEGEDEEDDGMDDEDEMYGEYEEPDLEYTAKDDLEFPDEIELDPRGSAKERLKRYRGVRNVRWTDWNPLEADERMPAEFTRLYRPGNLFATRNRLVKLLSEGAPAGSRVRVYLAGAVPAGAVDPMTLINRGASLTAYALLPGEEKLGYVNSTIAMDSEVTESIKSKSSIMVQYGPRRLLINPLFSQGGHTDNNVYRFNRYLHPGRSAVATFIAPVVLNNAPVVYYRTAFENEQVLLGSGSVLDSDANRVIVKQATLTGLPVKIHRKLITIRHMFFNREDVEWFRSVPLFTKLGAQGFIKECLGTHGLFKATFDKKIRSEDTIGMSLYKREWPKLAAPSPF